MWTNELFERPQRRAVREINIVPILDMLTTIIFFLLLSASFLQFNKVTVPPSRASASAALSDPPPMQPRMLLTQTSEGPLKLVLTWTGKTPGSAFASLTAGDNQALAKKAGALARKFKKDNPDEKSLQLGLGAQLPYATLVLVMDAVRDSLPDVVLLSYQDAEVVSAKMVDGGKP